MLNQKESFLTTLHSAKMSVIQQPWNEDIIIDSDWHCAVLNSLWLDYKL